MQLPKQCLRKNVVLLNFCLCVYIIMAGKHIGEHCDIKIKIDYEMKLKIYFISSF